MQTNLESIKALAAIRAEKIDTARLHEYTLLVQLGAGNLRYAVSETKKNRVLALEEYRLNPPKSRDDANAQLRSVLDHTEVLRLKGWGTIEVTFTAGKFSLVPSALFEAELAPEYLRLLAPAEADETVLHHTHKSGVVNVYAANNHMLAFFREAFGQQVSTLPHTALVIEGALQLADLNAGIVMLVKTEPDHVTVAVADDGRLLFCNVFVCRTDTDAAYYILLAMRELDLSPAVLPVYLCGSITTESEAYHKLYTYIRNLLFVPRPTFCQVGKAFSEADIMRYYDLFCLPEAK